MARGPRPRPPTTRDWFDRALAYATEPLRSDDGVRALIPLDDPANGQDAEFVGYGLADYLEQHLTRTRALRPVPDRMWDALRTSTSRSADLRRLAESAERYSRYQHCEALYRTAAAAGEADALYELAQWLRVRPGREADAEAIYREAAAAGDPRALRNLAGWLSERPGRETDAEAVWREAAAAGDPVALSMLAGWLRERPGREADVEAMYREAAAAGDPRALRDLAGWLSRQRAPLDRVLSARRPTAVVVQAIH